MIKKYLRYKNFNLFNSALKRLVPHFDTGGDFVVSAQSNDKGMCENAFNTHPTPLSRGVLKSCCRKRPSRLFWMGLRLAVAVTLLSCLLAFAFARIHRADSQRDVTAIENTSLSQKQFEVGWIKRSESTMSQNIEGGFGVKTNALIHPTHNLISQKKIIDGDDSSNEIESRFPSDDVTMPEKVSGKFKTLLQKTSLINIFKKGGLIMWPLLFASILAQGTVLERIVFLIGQQRKRNPQAMETFFAAVGHGDTERAIRTSKESGFYVLRVLGYALAHREKSLASALLYAQEQELKRFRRGIPILDMVITLAPLLGLLGTVAGMMGSFSLIGGELSTPGAITGGIAEALIATAFGLGIAITALIPFNLLNTRLEKARFEIESAATKLELLMHPPASTVTASANTAHPCQPVKSKFGHGKRNGLTVRTRMRIPMSFPKG